MNQMLRIAVLFFFFACAVLTSSGAKLTQQQLSKLHPFFRVLVGQGSSHLLKAEQAQKQAGTTPRTYGAIIYTHNAAAVRAAGVHVNSVLPEFVTAQISASDVERLASLESVRFIGRGSINYPQLEASIPEIGASLLHAGFINNTAYQGSGAIVLIYDTGIDWKHLRFSKIRYDTIPHPITFGIKRSHRYLANSLLLVLITASNTRKHRLTAN